MATVKERIFDFSKEIENNPNRQIIYESFKRIHIDEKTSGNLGYFGRQFYKQFLGYLVMNDQREKMNQNLSYKIEEMPKSTYDCFIYGHSFIKKINELCLYPLSEMFPLAYKVIDPYWEIDNTNKFYSNVEISDEKLNRLIRSFQNSKPFKILEKKLISNPQFKDLNEETVVHGVFGMRDRIRKFGLTRCPEDLFELGLRINMNTPDALIGSILFSLLYLNASIQCLDQILFQKFITDRLISLNEENLFDISNISSNAISRVYELSSSQPVLFCGDIIHVDIPRTPENIKDFCVVEEVKMSFSQDFGQEFKVGLRGTDDNFSFYGNLINDIRY